MYIYVCVCTNLTPTKTYHHTCTFVGYACAYVTWVFILISHPFRRLKFHPPGSAVQLGGSPPAVQPVGTAGAETVPVDMV